MAAQDHFNAALVAALGNLHLEAITKAANVAILQENEQKLAAMVAAESAKVAALTAEVERLKAVPAKGSPRKPAAKPA